MGQCFLDVTGVQAPRRMSKINVVLGAWSKSLKKALHSSVFWAPMPRRKLTSRALEQTQWAAATPLSCGYLCYAQNQHRLATHHTLNID